MERAAYFSASLPVAVRAAIEQFRTRPHASGALLVRGVPYGDIPATPELPTAQTVKDGTSERTLLAVAKLLGEPVGYRPEMNGSVVQNLVPTRANSDRQVSTSSSVTLLFHTETAFHPHRPSYLLLLCLRADGIAETTLSSIDQVKADLSPAAAEILFQRRFRTGVDESFLNGRENVLGPPVPVLSGDPDSPSLTFDEDLMIGTDADAQAALEELGKAVVGRHLRLKLEPGDLLIVDNHKAVHGRGPYRPRFDGTDRWLQRSFVIPALPASGPVRSGRILTTQFGRAGTPVPSSTLPGFAERADLALAD
ncbi:MAG: TauD/TfdA family dioxygenase [Proteobacteria bacterium]|nr:TauD/TfdA family dioxygenase [Pseudomonadota bacterium]